MAEIAAFRGILYTPKAGQPDKLLAPPYDVISAEERGRLAALDPHNCVRLILPEGAGDEKYGHAARDLAEWLRQGILARDAEPALYRYHQTFTAEGRTATRKGFICRIRLARFAERIVLPHERTLAGPKADRLKLKRATRAHLSQVFGLYGDRDRKSDAPFAAVEKQAPALAGKTSDGVELKLWRLTDPAAQAEVARLLADQKIYIADGHHRYETMLALRDELRAEAAGNPRSSVEYGTIFLANMDDPGLLVFPTHRVVQGLPTFDLPSLLERARRWFEVAELHVDGVEAVRSELQQRGRARPTFALATGDGKICYLSLLRDANLEAVPSLQGPAVLRTLDVTLLHALVLEELLGIDRAAQEHETHLRYVKDTGAALALAKEATVQAVFLMNPTPVEHVKAVADAGEVMPQKSTFFYPKLASGIVINPILPSEEV
jgi:uncharacterized protein (DUF1015 family)